MKCEESPDISTKNREREMKIIQHISRTPQGKKIGLDDLHLLGLHRDCSPNAYGSSQDKLEIGWGDSPEPLNIKQKSSLYATPVTCKKRLEAKESPKSRNGNIRPSMRISSKPPVDVAKYIAEVQELSKRILNEIDNERKDVLPVKAEEEEKEENDQFRDPINMDPVDLMNSDDVINEYLIACSQSLERTLTNCEINSNTIKDTGNSQSSLTSSSDAKGSPRSEKERDSGHSSSEASDSAFEKVLQSFISEEDDWLSQAVLNAEAKLGTPRKGSFVKTKSDNHLSSPLGTCGGDVPPGGRSNETRGTIRRTSSFDMFSSKEEKVSRLSGTGKYNERSHFLRNSYKTKKLLHSSERDKLNRESHGKGFR